MAELTADEQLTLAISIATAAHAGQTDKAGAPYSGHLERVAARCTDPVVKTVAWLHDVLEDTDVSADDLATLGISDEVIKAVVLMNRNGAASPDQYYVDIRSNPLSLGAKLADIADNSDPTRLALLPAELQTRLVAKYTKALAALID